MEQGEWEKEKKIPVEYTAMSPALLENEDKIHKSQNP